MLAYPSGFQSGFQFFLNKGASHEAETCIAIEEAILIDPNYLEIAGFIESGNHRFLALEPEFADTIIVRGYPEYHAIAGFIRHTRVQRISFHISGKFGNTQHQWGMSIDPVIDELRACKV
jgi:hypothetical protein